MTSEEDKIVLKALETFYLVAVFLKEAAASLDQLHRAYLIETLAPVEKDDGSDQDSNRST